MSFGQAPVKTFSSTTLGADVTWSGPGYQEIVAVTVTPRRTTRALVLACFQDFCTDDTTAVAQLFRDGTSLSFVAVGFANSFGINRHGTSGVAMSDLLTAGTAYAFKLSISANANHTFKATNTRIGVLFLDD